MSDHNTVDDNTVSDRTSPDERRDSGDPRATIGRDLHSGSGGYEMVFAGVIFALVGLWLDSRLGWTPILTIVLAILGFVGGTLGVYYRYKRDIAEIEAETAALRRRAA